MHAPLLESKISLIKASLVAAGALLATLSLGVAMSQKQAEAAFPGENGRIAFDFYDFQSPIEIYTMNPDGTDVQHLTNNDDPAFYSSVGAWSPDGTKIAFRGGYLQDNGAFFGDIWVMNADGSNRMQLTDTPATAKGSPVWSPDGTKIAFSQRVGNGFVISVMNADGSGQVNLTNTQSPGTSAPAWSPDGTKIAYSRCDVLDADFSFVFLDLWVTNADGSHQVNLTNETTPYTGNSSSDWSPDGTKIAFSRYDGLSQDIWVMNADGSNKVNLTKTPSDAGELNPSWSPDGTKIAYQKALVNGESDIWVMNADGSDQVNLTKTPSIPQHESNPDWQSLPEPTVPKTKADCKKSGYKDFGFKNQGRCIAFVNRATNSQ